MIIHDDIQGSPEWKINRKTKRNASEAPIVMGASKNVTRTEFLDMKALGTEQEFSEWFEKNILDRGHRVEALARPIAEAIVGEELYPISASSDDGYLSASFDGCTMLEDIIWECKQYNESKAADVREGRIPECDVWQVIHQLVVSGAEKCLYMVTDGTEDNTVHVWRSLNAGEEKTLRAAWALFDKDAESHQPAEPEFIPEGKAPDSLPALHIEVTGMVTASNLEQFKGHALAVIGGINKDLQTDEDFADAEKTVKWLGDVESRLDAAKEHALSQTASIDELFKALDDIKENARRTRLDLDKLVKARKEARKGEIRQEAVDAYRAHIEALNTRLGRVRLPDIAADFAGAMKGKRTISSLKDAVSVELARVKIASSEKADHIERNLKMVDAAGHPFLFADIQQLALKDSGDLAELIKARIANHEAEEKRKEDAQRERIRAEEEARARRDAESKAEQERQKIRQEEQAKAREDAQAKATDLHGPRGSIAYTADGQPAEKPRVRQNIGPSRPTDAQIIATVAAAFGVTNDIAMQWINEIAAKEAA